LRLIFGQVGCTIDNALNLFIETIESIINCTLDNAFNLFIETIESIINCTLQLSKDQPEDGPTVGPEHVAGVII
jgi:hypothetical protein